MESSSKPTSTGFVKSLLYPSFTDAGSNETFRKYTNDMDESNIDDSESNNVTSQNVENKGFMQNDPHIDGSANFYFDHEQPTSSNPTQKDRTREDHKAYLTSPPKMMRRAQNVESQYFNEPVESVTSLQFSDMENDKEKEVYFSRHSQDSDHPDGDEDPDTGAAVSTFSQNSYVNTSLNTSVGAASSVLGYKFLPNDDGNGDEGDNANIAEDQDENEYDNNDIMTVNTEAATAGRKRLNKQKFVAKTTNISPPLKKEDEDADADEGNIKAAANPESPSLNKDDDMREDQNFTSNEKERNVHFDNQNYHPNIEECDSNESVMGSEHRSVTSSHFEGTVIGNDNIDESMGSVRLNKMRGNKTTGNPGITAALLRAMEEEQKEKNNHSAPDRTDTSKEDEKILTRSNTPPPIRFDMVDSTDHTAQKSARRKKIDIFPMTTPPSRSMSTSPENVNDIKAQIGMSPRLVLPTLDAADLLKVSNASSSTPGRTNTGSGGPDIRKGSISNDSQNTQSIGSNKGNLHSPQHMYNKRSTVNNQSYLSPFQRARKCLSVDYDDSVVEGYTVNDEFSLNDERTTGLWRPVTSQTPTRFDSRKIEQAKSWDVGGSRHYAIYGRDKVKFVREKNIFISDQQDMQSLNYSSKSSGQTRGDVDKGSLRFQQRGKESYGMSKSTSHKNNRFLKSHEFSPAVNKDANFTLLQSPQRVELERDDALDILACLVERSIAFHDHVNDPDNSISSSESSSSPCTSKSDNHSAGINQINPCVEALQLVSQYYRDNPPTSPMQKVEPDHTARVAALNHLVRSHTYAIEMKRAALGASKWLETIRTSPSTQKRNDVSNHSTSIDNTTMNDGQKRVGDEMIEENGDLIEMRKRLLESEKKCIEREEYSQRLNEELSKCRAEIGRLKSSSRAEVLFTSPNRSILDFDEEEDSSASSASTGVKDDFQILENAFKDVTDVLDMDTAAQIIQEQNLEDDAKQKRQIILLKAELHKLRMQMESLKADKPNHANTNNINFVDENDIDERNSNNNEDDHNADVNNEGSVGATQQTFSIFDKALVKELEEYTEAIRCGDKAEIQSLKNQLVIKSKLKVADREEENKEGSISQEVSRNPLTSPISSAINSSTKSKPQTPVSPTDEKTINVRMLDAENFVTEWNSLAQPLPPPPDHGLRSPIVDTLLSQWTSDTSMHKSLLSWMERVMAGDDPSNIPPLQIASLDHQVRDGFSMHVLPLLLRRSDINVQVTTRAHRTTTYDIAVSISGSTYSIEKNHSAQDASLFSSQNVINRGNMTNTSMMAFKASNSANVIVDTAEEGEEEVSRNSGNTGRGMTGFWRSNNSDAGNGSVTSTSLTSPISNRDLSSNVSHYMSQQPVQDLNQHYYTSNSSKDPYANVPSSGFSVGTADESVGSSITGASSQRSVQHTSGPGIMSSIGSAFGGFLGRSKKNITPGLNHQRSQSYDEVDNDYYWNKQREKITNPNQYHQQSNSNQIGSMGFRPSQNYSPMGSATSLYSSLNQSHSPVPSHPDEEDHPYHRVVSAPPGRIGVTFVQFRGHAMVSDVAADSPLSGWVFPSDILIAIDEVPVSGMRVRDIVKLLTARVERQRALRMISTHAMEELTQPSLLE